MQFISRIVNYKWFVQIILLFTVVVSVFFASYKDTVSPPCFNADEAAFGYTAYSLLKTGADEYGTFLSLRLKSFGDYKMPLYSYLSVPFIGIFGLNEFSTRALNIFIAGLFPLAIYFLSKELFKKRGIGLLAAVLITFCLGKGIIAREAHEALLAAFLITVASYFFLKYLNTLQVKYGIVFVFSLFLALFSYQSSRLFAVLFVILTIIYLFVRNVKVKAKTIFLAVFVIALIIFGITDIIYKPARVQSLFLTSTAGFPMEIVQYLNEGGSRIFYNKLTVGVRDVFNQYMQYFSPQFLAENGDSNNRFGFFGMAPITPLEYLFLFVGIYYLFKNKEKHRFFILTLLFASPLTAALSWQLGSLTRAFFLLIPVLLISAYGFYHMLNTYKHHTVMPLLVIGLICVETISLFYSWDFYLNHYPKRAIVTQAWQCGYAQVATFIKNHYNDYNTFYITKKNGQPYIFMLYYLNYPPAQYQKQASLTAPDEFGFGQVEKFDKFVFAIPSGVLQKKVAVIGFPDDFNQISNIDKSKIKKIVVNNTDIFWIYTND